MVESTQNMEIQSPVDKDIEVQVPVDEKVVTVKIQDKFTEERDAMVKQLESRGDIKNSKIFDSMRAIPRQKFNKRAATSKEIPQLVVGIDPPTVIAVMIDSAKVKETDNVLEVGTGCGYCAAILSRLCKQVVTVEVERGLRDLARSNLIAASCNNNVYVVIGLGSVEVADHAPYDAILITALIADVSKLLKYQLKVGGRMVMLVKKEEIGDRIVRITKLGDVQFTEEDLGEVRLMPKEK